MRTERAKSSTAPPPSSVRQLQKLRLSPSPPLYPPGRNQSSFGSFAAANLPPSPSPSLLIPKPGSLRGQKSHTGLKPPTPPATRKLARKASLSSLMELSHANAPEPAAGTTSKARIARYEVPTAASLAKAQKTSATKAADHSDTGTRSRTPSSNSPAHRLTMPAQIRSKSRPSLSQVFVAQSPTHTPPTHGTTSLPRPPSSSSLRPSGSRTLKVPAPLHPTPPSPVTPPAPKLLKRPKRPKTYGDGTELDDFEDLPTDRDKECQYRVQPKGNGNRIPGASYSSKASSLAGPDKAKSVTRKKRRQGSTTNGS
jgi:hypothetical protein